MLTPEKDNAQDWRCTKCDKVHTEPARWSRVRQVVVISTYGDINPKYATYGDINPRYVGYNFQYQPVGTVTPLLLILTDNHTNIFEGSGVLTLENHNHTVLSVSCNNIRQFQRFVPLSAVHSAQTLFEVCGKRWDFMAEKLFVLSHELDSDGLLKPIQDLIEIDKQSDDGCEKLLEIAKKKWEHAGSECLIVHIIIELYNGGTLPAPGNAGRKEKMANGEFRSVEAKEPAFHGTRA